MGPIGNIVVAHFACSVVASSNICISGFGERLQAVQSRGEDSAIQRPSSGACVQISILSAGPKMILWIACHAKACREVSKGSIKVAWI